MPDAEDRADEQADERPFQGPDITADADGAGGSPTEVWIPAHAPAEAAVRPDPTAPDEPLEAVDDPAMLHAARSLRAMADDERKSAAYAQSAPIVRDDDDDSGGRAEERGTGAATVRERRAEHYEATASRYDQSRGDYSGSRRR